MSNFNPQTIVQQFAERTMKHLEFIESHKQTQKTDINEVTQLVNSLLGLIVFPKERFSNRLPKTPLADLINEGWPNLNFTLDLTNCKTLPHLIEHLRHGVSHSNIRFLGNEQNGIVGIVLWNCDPKTKKKLWEVRMSTGDLREFVRKFNDLLQVIPKEAAAEMVIES